MAFDGYGLDRRAVLRGAGAVASVSLLHLDAAAAAEAAPLVLTAAASRLALRAGAETAVLAFAGQVPGPLLRLTLGGRVDVTLDNRLDRPATISWAGVRLPNAMDGVAGLTQPAVKPGERFSYRFVPPDAGLYWYRPQVWPDSPALVGRGLYGLLLVDEPAPPPVDADLLVVIDDWMLGPDGQIAAVDGGHAVLAKPLLTANSHPLPIMEGVRPGARVRLRLLNACGSRLAVVGCSGMAASVIAVDGQPSGLFEPARGTVPIGPGSRFELMLDLPRDAKAEAVVMLQMQALPEQPLLRFVLKGDPLPPRGAVLKLPDNPLLPTRIHLESSLKRDLVIAEAGGSADAAPARPLPGKAHDGGTHAGKDRVGKDRVGKVQAGKDQGGKARADEADAGTPPPAGAVPAALDPSQPLGWTLAGKPVDGLSGAPLFTVKRGAAVTLAFVNRTGFAQQALVHGHSVRVLHDLDDGWDPYWRDTVLVGPERTKHVAFVADNPGRWMIEAVALDHPGPSLAAYFTVA